VLEAHTDLQEFNMTAQDFDKFVDAQQVTEEQETFSAKRQLDEWFAFLDRLYEEIRAYMAHYIDTGRAAIEFREIQLNEEFSGTYSIREMILRIGRSTIVFRPIGTMLIGAKGRVDVEGPRGSARLSLVDRNVTAARDLIRVTATILKAGESFHPAPLPKKPEVIEWAWKIITPPPEMRFIELNKDEFFQMVLAISNA
jgi:hypothetical protein